MLSNYLFEFSLNWILIRGVVIIFITLAFNLLFRFDHYCIFIVIFYIDKNLYMCVFYFDPLFRSVDLIYFFISFILQAWSSLNFIRSICNSLISFSNSSLKQMFNSKPDLLDLSFFLNFWSEQFYLAFMLDNAIISDVIKWLLLYIYSRFLLGFLNRTPEVSKAEIHQEEDCTCVYLLASSSFGLESWGCETVTESRRH